MSGGCTIRSEDAAPTWVEQKGAATSKERVQKMHQGTEPLQPQNYIFGGKNKSQKT
jgi:hypothetical protein